MDQKTESKIIPFNPVQKKESKDKLPTYCIGTIFLDLMLSYDGKSLYLRPSSQIEDGIPDNLLDSFNNMLNKFFPEILNQLFDLYKSTR